ncbi:DNA methyltransferase [Tabrizicola sp.]|uniref:class I SAM-dependent DNA methyltransferase n=1 Tax=Tabrizicola sp. TaxID=2005166 RepID=UPI0025D5184E|nr:DNA methyltransferase [Tabrizicola sp.]MBY0350397.1 N-6 DNA methylase [Tabrizicola sp.]
MTPDEFIGKWRAVELKERSASQSHFNDLCRLLALPDPIAADPKGEWFAFEHGVSKAGGGEGWADVWRKDCFGWEYKGKRRDLKAALNQLLGYSQSLGSPPLLIVSDTDRIEIHTNWNNTVQKKYDLSLDDLRDAGKRDLLRACFTDPEKLKPAQTRADLTEEAAQKFVAIAERLRQRRHDPHAVAHFVNRLVFCMFAEDVGLLPDGLFSAMIEECRGNNAHLFQDNAAILFRAMRDKGGKVGFKPVEWFNGGLFDSDEALPLTYADIDDLKRAAHLNWSDIDPSIMGTLFERGLDPDKRSQLGAHYTDRDKIMMIVTPVIVEPLLAEWAAVLGQIRALVEGGRKGAVARAQALKSGFLERLARFRVLDPACGSGNFLYLSLQALKDIEHRVNLEAEALGLQRDLPRTGPENMLGIELNPYAAELARVSVWIGDIQWVRRNGGEVARNPILRKLDTIENRDAVLAPDGTRAEWPKADVVVGNPPFLGNKKMIRELGEEYTFALRKAWDRVPGGADLVCYWFAKAWEEMQAGRLTRAGLVATNSIRGGANRAVLKPIVEGGRIFEAWGDEGWTVDGAAVRVSLVCFDGEKSGEAKLDGAVVGEISSDLKTTNHRSIDKLEENDGWSFQGAVLVGAFDIVGEQARQMLVSPTNPNGKKNQEVVRPLRNGRDLTSRHRDVWVIDFASMKESEACLFEKPFEYVRFHVFPIRSKNRRVKRAEAWWQHGETGSGWRKAITSKRRYIATSQVSKHRMFVWLDPTTQPHQTVIAIARDDDTTFGILHSRFHELWALRMGTSLEDRPRYTPSTTFETFPFPEGLTPDIPASEYATDPRAMAIAAAAARLNELRENWLNPPDLVIRVPEVVAGYPDRILPKDDKAAAILKTRTLTNLYNQRPAWLDHAHAALDQAVAEAYGWGEEWRAGLLREDEVLARLFRLNQARTGSR